MSSPTRRTVRRGRVRHLLRRRAAPLVALAGLLAACGGDDPDPEPPPVVDVEPDATDESDEPDDDEPSADASDAADVEVESLEPEPDDRPDPDLGVALSLVEIASLSPPTAAAVGPDGTFYVATRLGTVHPVVDDTVGDAVVDISSDTTTDSERGLLGLAFASSGDELFLSSTDRNGDTVISAVPVEDGAPVDRDRRTIFTLAQPMANHNGGDIAVGPDGMLYIAMGTVAVRVTPRRPGRTWPRRSARCCASIPPLATGTASPRTTRSSTPGTPRRRSSPTGCATPGGSRSTGRPVMSGSRTSARTRVRRSTVYRWRG